MMTFLAGQRPRLAGHLQTLFNRITLRVVFGDAARTDDAVLSDLDALMRRANRVVFRWRSRRAFARFNAAIHGYVPNGFMKPGVPADFLPVQVLHANTVATVVNAGVWTWKQICAGAAAKTPTCVKELKG